MFKTMDSLNRKIAILIPAYNEAKYIKDVVNNCSKYELDIIVVNDGSTDNTSEIIKSIPNPEKSSITLLGHSFNRGKGQSLKTGFDYAVANNYEGVITIDADGQHKVSEISNFLQTLEKNNPDIIVGSRFKNIKGMPFIRLATNYFTSWIISLIAGNKIEDVQSGFRYINSKVLKNIEVKTKNFDAEPELLVKASWSGYKIINTPISTIYHKTFTSYVNPIKDTIKFIKLVFNCLLIKKRYTIKKK